MILCLSCLPNTSDEATYEIANPFAVTELSVAKITVISLLDDITSSGTLLPHNVKSSIPVAVSLRLTLSLVQPLLSCTSNRSKWRSTLCQTDD